MKYGFNDCWHDDLSLSVPAKAIVTFNIDSFIPFMKRKTITADDKVALAALTEMVEMMNEHAKTMKEVEKL